MSKSFGIMSVFLWYCSEVLFRKVKMVVVAATTTRIKWSFWPLERKATCLLQQIAHLFIIWYSSIYYLYYTQSSVVCQYVWEYFKHEILIKHKRPDFYSKSFNTYVTMVWARCAQTKGLFCFIQKSFLWLLKKKRSFGGGCFAMRE